MVGAPLPQDRASLLAIDTGLTHSTFSTTPAPSHEDPHTPHCLPWFPWFPLLERLLPGLTIWPTPPGVFPTTCSPSTC